MSKSAPLKNLSLYHYQACPFCALTRQAIKDLGLEIELRDIRRSRAHEKGLIQGGGKRQVPSLKVEYQDGSEYWLYESRDIIHYLAKQADAIRAVA